MAIVQVPYATVTVKYLRALSYGLHSYGLHYIVMAHSSTLFVAVILDQAHAAIPDGL